MADPPIRERRWTIDLLPDEVRLRCSYKRAGQRMIRYVVQLELRIQGRWVAVERYDNAHGFCHWDTIHADGTTDKTPVYFGDAAETFTRAITALQTDWPAHRARYLAELRHD